MRNHPIMTHTRYSNILCFVDFGFVWLGVFLISEKSKLVGSARRIILDTLYFEARGWGAGGYWGGEQGYWGGVGGIGEFWAFRGRGESGHICFVNLPFFMRR